MSFAKKSDVKKHFSPRNGGEIHLYLPENCREAANGSQEKHPPGETSGLEAAPLDSAIALQPLLVRVIPPSVEV